MKLKFWLIFFVLSIFLLVFQYNIAVNIPWWDDFHGILLPVDTFLHNNSLVEKFEILFSQNNEHRIAIDRLALLVITLLSPSGIAEMKFLAMSGTFFLFGIVVLLIYSGRKNNLSYLQLLPVPIIVLSVHSYEILQSLMVPYQVFAVLFLSFSTFHFAIQRKHIFFLLLLSTIAIFSHGNGLLTIPIVALILLLQIDYKKLIIWAVYSVSIIVFYFTNYVSPPWNNNVSPLENPLASFLYFFEFIGSFSIAFIDISASASQGSLVKTLPTIVGILLFGLFLYSLAKKYLSLNGLKISFEKLRNSKIETFWISCLIFLFATGLMMALKRTGFPMSSRYVINSQLVLVLVYLFTSPKIKSPVGRKLLWVSPLTYYFLCIYNYTAPSLVVKEAAIVDAFNWQNNKIWAAQYTDYTQTFHLNELLDKPYKNGTYEFPESTFENLANATLSNEVVKLESHYNGKVLNVIHSDSSRKLFGSNTQKYLLLNNERNEFLYHFAYEKNGFGNIFKERDYFNDQIRASVYTELIPKGVYKIGLVSFDGSEYTIIASGDSLINLNETTPFRN